MRTLFVFALLALAALGCGSTVLEASRFERTCVNAGQCRPVLFGDICQPCQCLNGAVNEQGFGKYEVERQAIRCAAVTPTPMCAACPQPLVACEDGGCVLQ